MYLHRGPTWPEIIPSPLPAEDFDHNILNYLFIWGMEKEGVNENVQISILGFTSRFNLQITPNTLFHLNQKTHKPLPTPPRIKRSQPKKTAFNEKRRKVSPVRRGNFWVRWLGRGLLRVWRRKLESTPVPWGGNSLFFIFVTDLSHRYLLSAYCISDSVCDWDTVEDKQIRLLPCISWGRGNKTLPTLFANSFSPWWPWWDTPERTFKKHFFLFIYWLNWEGEISICYSIYLLHSLIDSCMCPDWGSNPQSTHVRDDAPTKWGTTPGKKSYVLIDLVFY